MDNLNAYQLENDGNFDVRFVDNSVIDDQGVSVYFRNIRDHLISRIRSADAVFGAVAWLTEGAILDALADLANVSIIVQKEDFLRPDVGSGGSWKDLLRNKYGKLKCNATRYAFNNILNSVSVATDPSMDAIRCVGNHNKDKAPAFPRMHNKFLVFARVCESADSSSIESIDPYAVWTGSFNFTRNAGMSLENAMYITTPQIVDAYFKEYGQIAAMSEKLDWNSEWTEPEWRIGT